MLAHSTPVYSLNRKARQTKIHRLRDTNKESNLIFDKQQPKSHVFLHISIPRSHGKNIIFMLSWLSKPVKNSLPTGMWNLLTKTFLLFRWYYIFFLNALLASYLSLARRSRGIGRHRKRFSLLLKNRSFPLTFLDRVFSFIRFDSFFRFHCINFQ